MRVLFLSFPYTSSHGGGERYTEQAVEGLLRTGHEATLVSSSNALLATFKARGWKMTALWCGLEPMTPFAALVFPLTALIAMPMLFLLLAWFRYARGTKAIVCLSFIEKLIATPIARLFGMRVIWTEHLVAGRSLRLNPYRGWYVACSRHATVVTVSEAAASALIEVGVPKASIRIIPPGTAPEAVSPAPDQPVIGTISRLSPEKNVGLLLQAFALVAKEMPEAKLEIFGDGAERRDLEALAKKLHIAEKTVFHGYVEHASDHARFSVLAVPSARESFGVAALEAMARGTAIVATRVGGLPEVITDVETGLLVPPNDAPAMAGALLKLLRDKALAARMGEAGRARAESLFTEEKMQRAWTALFS